ncbi:MAG: BlaI/MecI/CopY family transcriptional regulator [Anaerolineae bacterium]
MDRHDRLSSFKLDRRGLARVFGELEAEIMDVVWDVPQATVDDVCARLGQDSNYKTVMTVMNRLVEKGALHRRRDSRAFAYVAAETRLAFVNRVSRHVAESLVEEYGALAVAQFVDALDAVDPALLGQLSALVEARGPHGALAVGDDSAGSDTAGTSDAGAGPDASGGRR